MKQAADSLLAGLREISRKPPLGKADNPAWMLGYLRHEVGLLIEGNAEEKRKARSRLQKLIGRGRCILNAADFSAKESAGGAQ